MAIHYDLTAQGDTLQARAWGFDESLEDVQAYGLAIIEACREHNVTCVLCDERELEYRLNSFEHDEAAEFIARQVPALAKAAIVCNPHCLPAADLYEDVAVNRRRVPFPLLLRRVGQLAVIRRHLAAFGGGKFKVMNHALGAGFDIENRLAVLVR